MRDFEVKFTEGEIEGLSRALGDTTSGLTGSDIGSLLAASAIKDMDPFGTKWRRLNDSFIESQNRHGNAIKVLNFVTKALAPARFLKNKHFYFELLKSVNEVLSFCGIEIKEDGRIHRVNKATTLTEAQQRASKLEFDLKTRNVHPYILKCCRSELLVDNYFHAVLEATKGISQKIKDKTGLTGDGAKLIDDAFSGKEPKLKINSFSTETEKSEQKGFVNLSKGLFGTFRNPVAHESKLIWEMQEDDALDLMVLASYVVRRIDNSI